MIRLAKAHLVFLIYVFIVHAGLSAPVPLTSLENPRISFQIQKHQTVKIKYHISRFNDSYCYDIYVDGKLLIRQTSIPGLQGNKGFKSKKSAKKVARLVIEKIREGYMPPTITITELKKLKAI